jgi:hypothetical protein
VSHPGGFRDIAASIPPATVYTNETGAPFSWIAYAFPEPVSFAAPGLAYTSLQVSGDAAFLAKSGIRFPSGKYPSPAAPTTSTNGIFTCFLLDGPHRHRFESGEENGPFSIRLDDVPPVDGFFTGTFQGGCVFSIQSNTNGGPWTVIATNLPLSGGRFRLKRVADNHPDFAG